MRWSEIVDLSACHTRITFSPVDDGPSDPTGMRGTCVGDADRSRQCSGRSLMVRFQSIDEMRWQQTATQQSDAIMH